MNEVQNFNTHSFSPYLAERFGWKDAVFLQHIYYWVKHNKGKRSNCHDGNWWTYNTRKGFAEYFRYLTEDDIRGVIDRLKEKKMLLIGNYNKIPWDKTAWYALTEFSWQLFGDTIGEIPQSKGESPKSSGDKTISSGEEAKSKEGNSPDNTNSKTSLNNPNPSLSKTPKFRTLEECIAHAEKEKYFIDVLKFHKYYYGDLNDLPKKGMSKLMMSWAQKPENQFYEKATNVKIVPTEPEEIKKIREEIKVRIYRANYENGMSDHIAFFQGKPIEKTPSGYLIKVDDGRALRYEEVLKQIKVEIEIK